MSAEPPVAQLPLVPMTPDLLAKVMEATWPAAAVQDLGPFRLRDGAGGGKRVSAATAEDEWGFDDLDAAEAAMEQPLFAIRDGDEQLDQALAFRGYQLIDPVVAYAAPVAELAAETPFLTTFPHWPPLEAVRSIWAAGGIGPGRVAVMERVEGPKTIVLGRAEDRPAGAAFVALHGSEAMMHALEVRDSARRQGLGVQLLAAAAQWAQQQGASRFSLVVTEQNTAARALYARAGMAVVGRYHYRSL